MSAMREEAPAAGRSRRRLVGECVAVVVTGAFHIAEVFGRGAL